MSTELYNARDPATDFGSDASPLPAVTPGMRFTAVEFVWLAAIAVAMITLLAALLGYVTYRLRQNREQRIEAHLAQGRAMRSLSTLTSMLHQRSFRNMQVPMYCFDPSAPPSSSLPSCKPPTTLLPATAPNSSTHHNSSSPVIVVMPDAGSAGEGDEPHSMFIAIPQLETCTPTHAPMKNRQAEPTVEPAVMETPECDDDDECGDVEQGRRSTRQQGL
eukprot:jgi/Chlat1/2339/Chrsp17S02620